MYCKSLVIDSNDAGERLDRALASRFADVSRAQLTKWINDGSVLVDGSEVKPNRKLRGGEQIEIKGSFSPRQDWDSAEDMPLSIIYEDEDVLVIDKPVGLVVHPGAATVAPTLANGLLALRPRLRDLPRAGIVHRLDKDTSGLLIVAMSEFARVRLIAALAKHEVARTYLAVVEGLLDEQLEVDLPLGRSSRDRTRQTVRDDGKDALTVFKPIARFRAHSLVQAELKTGRTHQIRVHAARTGHPLVGDVKYGAKRILPHQASTALRDQLKTFPRQALHAHQLAFAHPRTDQKKAFESPVPIELANLIHLLQQDKAQPDA